MSHIFQINASGGGVPKLPLRNAEIDDNGITVDDQTHKDIHGGLRQKICLLRLETILALQQEGHPIYPGSTGENITTFGLTEEQMQPGQQLKLGDSAIIELTDYTSPCTHIGDSFSERNFNRINAKKHPGWSRIYARIVQGGQISTGDPITVL